MTKAEIENDETVLPDTDADLPEADAGEHPPPEEDEESTGTSPTTAAADADAADPGEGEPGVEPEDELAAVRKELDELNDRHLRLAAEFTNYRRRSEQDRLEAWSRAQADLVTRFLDVLDDLHRVAQLDLSNATVDAIMEGVDLVERKFMRMLEEAGVEVIDPVGEPFDPERMEAMMRVVAEAAEDDDTVAQVFAKGYTLDGILVRPARVSVHKVG